MRHSLGKSMEAWESLECWEQTVMLDGHHGLGEAAERGGGQGLLCASVFVSFHPQPVSLTARSPSPGPGRSRAVGSVCWMLSASSAPTCSEVAAHQTLGGGVAEGQRSSCLAFRPAGL